MDQSGKRSLFKRLVRRCGRRWCWPVACIGLMAYAKLAMAADDEPPFGLVTREPWTSSRLVGSPEPPLPYTVEKTFDKIAWKAPIYIIDEPGTGYLLVVERGGEKETPSRIVRLKDDPATRETKTFFEVPRQLIYAVCFDPAYCSNRWIYVFANGPTPEPERKDRVSRFRVTTGPNPHIDAKSEKVILEWSSSGHDGGDLAFGNDGMLYITTGDGSGDSDTFNSGQTIDDLLGAVLRIDVHRRQGARPYAIPADNPFVKTPGARGEIWAYGLRNPWRIGVDRRTGHVWVGNNGQDQWETAHLVRRGENYGWSVYEGSHPFYLQRHRGPTPIVPPTIEHSHAEFRSLTGGVVYYGKALPELNGAYIYADYSSGRVWGMKHDGRRVIWHRELADTALAISGFRADPRGQLLVLDLTGAIYRLARAPKTQQPAPFPALLSQTGLFASTAEHRPADGLIPYSVNVAGWADGAKGERFMALPGSARIACDVKRQWTFPDGTALVQTLSHDQAPDATAARLRIETRVLLRQQGEWAGYTYRWNAEQTDALLVDKNGGEAEIATYDPTDGSRLEKWRFPSRGDCMACHSRAANYVLGLNEAQLNRDHDYPLGRDNQLRALDHVGVFDVPLAEPPAELARLVSLDDESQDVESRARAYLHVNCSACHVPAGGGNARMDLSLIAPRDRMEVIAARPQHDIFGIDNAMIVAPGDPERSVMLHRISRRTRGQMPPLGTDRVDHGAVALMTRWIAQLKPARPIVRQWQMDDLLPSLDDVKAQRSSSAGQSAFRETGCAQCHRFAGEGGSVGPDLTNIGKRVAPRDLLESILLPSKVVADEYANYAIDTSDGRTVTGRIEREDARSLVLRPPASGDAPIRIQKSDVVERRRLSISNMPEGTVNVLEKDEVLDLLAYLLSGGRAPLGVSSK
jgi:uncharacterized repeat protein (TIGR03806 family)